MEFFEAIILGAVQGVAEWIPISSEGVTLLVATKLFEGSITIKEMITISLYLHLGTFLAALIYFKKDIWYLIKQLFQYKKANEKTKNLINFYIIATLVSGLLGLLILGGITELEGAIAFSQGAILITLGILLLLTGLLQIWHKHEGKRVSTDINITDGIITGVAQGLAVIPGFSRSGFTVSALLLRGIKDTDALKLSFILSLPIVLIGNIILDTSPFIFTLGSLMGLTLSFVFGLLTIHGLLKLSQKFQFGWFVIFFGVLVIGSVLI
ncbi:MAG: UDP-diphosphatase [Candidatus Colwellbacteria bacterium CG10_big_fil_rev_8_21_14_0_10_42_22]|uniref:Undecaprenyl-diphosphatase n=1 Tax=Candidatus Colwellbacteria bacterium CG10_big_fil_rev_8_21_14_0_10_42_22 TaxID=1974540 RepID=A0A2H0VGP3_9BACT|nr:MAG: UDP-diphosphatase [Candidatus Colwellbacteria bacterium CG10_big_fil_rev_8_21_14_0_10_42_22]